VLGVFFFFTNNQLPIQTGVETPYVLCKHIVNLFKKLFKIIPSLKSLLDNELNQMVNNVINSRQLDPSISNKIFLEVITMLGNETPLDSMTDFFMKLSDELKLNYFLHNGNTFQFQSKALGELCSRRIQENSSLGIFLKNQTATVRLMQTLNHDDLAGILECCKRLTIQRLQGSQKLDNDYMTDLFEVTLLIIVSMNIKTHVQLYYIFLLIFIRC